MKLSLAAAALLLLLSHPFSVSAQTCTEDADCAPEDYCDRYPSSGDSAEPSGAEGAPALDCEPGTECLEPATEAGEDETAEDNTAAPPMGECERGGRECTADSDCLAEYYCSLDQVSQASCPPGGDCEAIEPPSPSGRCEHQPYTCQADADCPDPTVCGEDGECVYELEMCEPGQDCGANYECISVRGGEADDSQGVSDDVSEPKATSGGSPGSSASAGGDESAQESDSSASSTGDEEDEPFGICFPELVLCEAERDCPEGWTCAEVDDGPPGWGDVGQACLPPGIAAALNGELEVAGNGGSSESSDTATEGSGTLPGEDADDVETPLGTQGGSEGSASDQGCGVVSSAHRGTSRSVLFALILGVGLVRRRRARTLQRSMVRFFLRRRSDA